MSCDCVGLQGRYQFEPESRLEGYQGFTADGKAAIAASPDYFLWWYSAKSIALVVAIAGMAYYIGRNRRPPGLGRHRRRR